MFGPPGHAVTVTPCRHRWPVPRRVSGVDDGASCSRSATPGSQLKSRTIAFGCSFGTTGPYKVRRTLTFTLRPVTAQDKYGKRLPLPRNDVRQLAGVLS